MSTLMILQCTGAKEPGGKPMPVHDLFAASLDPIRNQLIAQYQPIQHNTQLKPAYERYGAGQLYKHLDWSTALQKIAQGSMRIIIVSALYGALEHDTPIPKYDLTMAQAQQHWLAGNRLGNAIQSYVLANPDITRIQSFVSTSYYFPAMGHFTPPGVINLGNQWIPYSRGARVALDHINLFLKRL